MDKLDLQYLAAMLGDMFDSLRKLAATADRIAAAAEERTEIERKRLVAEKETRLEFARQRASDTRYH